MIRFSKYVTMLIFLMKVVALSYNKVCNQTLFLNFDPLNNILGLYKQKQKAQKNLYLTKILKVI